MKCEETLREFEVWDPEQSATQAVQYTDAQVVRKGIPFVKISQIKDSAIRILLELSGVDPDRYSNIGDYACVEEFQKLSALIDEAAKNLKKT